MSQMPCDQLSKSDWWKDSTRKFATLRADLRDRCIMMTNTQSEPPAAIAASLAISPRGTAVALPKIKSITLAIFFFQSYKLPNPYRISVWERKIFPTSSYISIRRMTDIWGTTAKEIAHKLKTNNNDSHRIRTGIKTAGGSLFVIVVNTIIKE